MVQLAHVQTAYDQLAVETERLEHAQSLLLDVVCVEILCHGAVVQVAQATASSYLASPGWVRAVVK